LGDRHHIDYFGFVDLGFRYAIAVDTKVLAENGRMWRWREKKVH
jgi:hypothetical protein